MPPRATWVWDRPTPEVLLSWVRAEGVREVYLGVGHDPDASWVRSIVDLLRGHGVRVAALGGDPGWIDDPGAALAWQRAVLRTRFFDAVHVDVEPWMRGDWKVRPVEVGASYLSLLRSLREGCTLPFEADIAFHLHQVPTASGDSLESAVLGVLDAVTVLSFRNTVTGPDSITDIARSALAAAGRRGVPCRLAVETGYLGDDPASRKQTFHGLGKPALDRALTEVDALLGSTVSYAGMAVHDYKNWRLL